VAVTVDTSAKVVVHYKDGRIVKGFLQPEAEEDPDSTKSSTTPPQLESIYVNDGGAAGIHPIDPAQAKAIFVVRSHEGLPDHEEVRFFGYTKATDALVRVKFADGEVMEGQVSNNIELIRGDGFWIHPFDHTSNNVMIYVHKSSVAEFQIMGVANPHKASSARPGRNS
jgi:hypothetical protein